MSSFNNPTYKYIESAVIINEVKNLLSSYFDQGTLDESILYPKIKWCLDKMGLKVHPLKSAMVQIVNKQGRLPLDFYKLSYAVGCGSYEQWEDMDGIDQFTPKITEKRIYEIPACRSSFDYCTNECGETYEIIQSFEQLKYRYWDFFNIRVRNEEVCTNDCINKQYSSEYNEIDIRNGIIFTNFSGSIHLDYIATMENNEGDLLIPDYSQITEWIKLVLIVECFRKLFYNGENTVQQRLQVSMQELTVKQLDALNFWKANEVQDFYDLRRVLKARYSKHKTAIRGDSMKSEFYTIVGQNQYI